MPMAAANTAWHYRGAWINVCGANRVAFKGSPFRAIKELGMSDNRVRVAVVGCGKMGINHVRTILGLEHSELVAVVDPRLTEDTRPDAVPSQVPLYTDPAAMYEAVKPDIVHIVTPPESHVALATEALDAGAHVYVEKPFALTAEDAESILNTARSRSLTVCAGHQLLFHPNYLRVLETLPVVGQPVHVESYFSFRPVRRISPADQLIDILPHPTYTLLGVLDAVGDGESGRSDLKSVETSADGEVRAVFRRGECLATLVVSLQGRPVESYLKVVAGHGSVNADFILSGVTRHFGAGATAVSVILKPFSEALQRVGRSLASLWGLVRGKGGGYTGLRELIESFHDRVRQGGASPVSPEMLMRTTEACESIISDIRARCAEREAACAEKLATLERKLETPSGNGVLVTGAAGFLGSVVCRRLVADGWRVIGVTRRELGSCERVAGVQYQQADLADGVPEAALKDVEAIVHLAAETAGGLAEHERNTVLATRRLIEQAAEAGTRRFVNISSVAVMKPGASQQGRRLSESSPIDRDNMARGPYVWAKAEAEALVSEKTAQGIIDGRTIRLGPLVDYGSFYPPGRLGREVGPWFVGVGRKNGPLSVCDVSTAADVIAYYLADFEQAPALVNLLDPQVPTRRELADRFLEGRPDLRRLWIPDWLLRAMSLALKGVLRLRRPGQKPLDVYAAFSAEAYDVSLAASLVSRARERVDERSGRPEAKEATG